MANDITIVREYLAPDAPNQTTQHAGSDGVVLGRWNGGPDGLEQPCEVILEDPGISRIHAGINQIDDQFYIINLSVGNVFRLNGRWIKAEESGTLADGDVLQIGSFYITVTRKGKEYETFCFKSIAAIGTLPTTIMDRSIVVPLIRKGAQEKVERYKAKENDDASVLRAMIERFVTDRSDQIQNAEPGELAMSNDRAADNWEPLFAIAHCAGPQWLKNAHQAASDLTPGDDEIPLVLEEFICDMVSIFVRTGADFISTFDLIEALCKDENKPWATYSRSQQKMSIHDLGKLMREAKVKVGEQKHDANGNRRGYYRRDVEHLFDGYGPNAASI